MKLNTLFCLFTICLLFTGCSQVSNEKEASCNAPKPEAVFDDKPSSILSHSFSLHGHNAEEQLAFEDDSSLTLFQSGCEKIVQEFRFTFPQKVDGSRTTIAVDRLMYLSNLNDKYMSFANWAQAIESLEAQFAQQDNVEVEKGFFVGLDKIDSADQTILMVKLFQK